MRFLDKFVMLFILTTLFSGCAYELGKKETFARQIGTYALDINRTELGEYKKDSNVYKNLTITFKEDSTFLMNMQAPFFADTLGTWIAGDGLAYSYNQLFFHNKEYKNLEGAQFFPPYLNGSDTIFLINGANPTKNKTAIQKIYFRKLGR
jgi:hypothetical protein